jgi:hypothetical protein
MQQDRIGMTEFIGEVILKINIKADKIKAEVYENQDKSLSDLQTLIKHSFLLNFLHKLLVSILSVIKTQHTGLISWNKVMAAGIYFN